MSNWSLWKFQSVKPGRMMQQVLSLSSTLSLSLAFTPPLYTSFTVEAERAYINGLTGRDILHVAISSTFDGPTENQVVNVLLARNQAASDSDALYHNLNRTLNVIHTTIANPAQSANQAIVDTSQPASHRRLIYQVQTQAIKSLCNFCPWLA